MPKEGQKTVTISGKTLKTLERYYKEELSKVCIIFRLLSFLQNMRYETLKEKALLHNQANTQKD
jgi:hypothetical protein